MPPIALTRNISQYIPLFSMSQLPCPMLSLMKNSMYLFILFIRCYYCDASLHVGSYTLHRDNRGQARFYCNQHVGKERQSLKRGLSDAVDNSSAGSSRPTSMLYDSTPSASNSSHDEVNINEVITEESCKFVH